MDSRVVVGVTPSSEAAAAAAAAAESVATSTPSSLITVRQASANLWTAKEPELSHALRVLHQALLVERHDRSYYSFCCDDEAVNRLESMSYSYFPSAFSPVPESFIIFTLLFMLTYVFLTFCASEHSHYTRYTLSLFWRAKLAEINAKY